jgi:hypothetical protein
MHAEAVAVCADQTLPAVRRYELAHFRRYYPRNLASLLRYAETAHLGLRALISDATNTSQPLAANVTFLELQGDCNSNCLDGGTLPAPCHATITAKICCSLLAGLPSVKTSQNPPEVSLMLVPGQAYQLRVQPYLPGAPNLRWVQCDVNYIGLQTVAFVVCHSG